MTIFAIETDASVELLNFMAETTERIKGHNIATNPFTGMVKQIPNTKPGDTLAYVIQIEPIYPRFYLFGGVYIILGFLLNRGWTPWLLPGFGILSLGFLWTKYFYYIFLTMGLRKAGHKSKVKLITSQDTIMRFLDVII